MDLKGSRLALVPCDFAAGCSWRQMGLSILRTLHSRPMRRLELWLLHAALAGSQAVGSQTVKRGREGTSSACTQRTAVQHAQHRLVRISQTHARPWPSQVNSCCWLRDLEFFLSASRHCQPFALGSVLEPALWLRSLQFGFCLRHPFAWSTLATLSPGLCP